MDIPSPTLFLASQHTHDIDYIISHIFWCSYLFLAITCWQVRSISENALHLNLETAQAFLGIVTAVSCTIYHDIWSETGGSQDLTSYRDDWISIALYFERLYIISFNYLTHFINAVLSGALYCKIGHVQYQKVNTFSPLDGRHYSSLVYQGPLEPHGKNNK